MVERRAAFGFWIAITGLLPVVGALAPLFGAGSVLDPRVSLALVLGGCAVALIGLGMIAQAQRAHDRRGPNAPSVASTLHPSGSSDDQPTHPAAATFLDWLEHAPRDTALWPAFDQLVREMLQDGLRAQYVRCYRLGPGDHALIALSDANIAAPPDVRTGLLGHVATTGRPFLAPETRQGKLLVQLAESEPEHRDVLWPIRRDGKTVGIIACGSIDWRSRSIAQVRGLLRLVQVFWLCALSRVELDAAQTRDKATGVLTRSDLFTAAEAALSQSYLAFEPVVVVVLTLEGLRGLDDAGQWTQRDDLLERIGRLIQKRTRSDDVIGRFSDERFAVVLRRLDAGLGRLITEKVLDAIEAEIREPTAHRNGGVLARAGLAASGFEQRPLAELLTAALAANETARHRAARLVFETDPARPEVVTT